MQSDILEALPGINGMFIGVGVAFFSAYVMYAYQKLQETKDQLNKAILDFEAFSSPSSIIYGGKIKLLNEDGELDWDNKAKGLLRYATSIYAYLDDEEKFGIPRSSYWQPPNDDEVTSTCISLCEMFYFLFVTYPFNGQSVVGVPGMTKNTYDKKSLPFDKARLQEIERRIHFLSFCWDTSKRALIILGQKSTEIKIRNDESDALKRFKEAMARTPELPEQEKQRIWKTFFQPRLKLQTDYSQSIVEYFNKVFMFRDNVLPKLKDLNYVHETFNKRLRVKSNTLFALRFFSFISFFGVIAPLVLENLKQDYGLVWLSILPYLLLLITTLSYMHVCIKLYKLINALDFK